LNPNDNPHVAPHCRIDGPILQGMIEFQTFRLPSAGTPMVDLSMSPGTLRRDASGRVTLLHIAPRRFLAPAPTLEIARELDALQAAGVGVRFDVDGKWQTFAATGGGVERVFSSTINLTQVLNGRDCAALHLFDCPAILARRTGAFDIWVEASYATAFQSRMEDIAGHLNRAFNE